MPAPYFPCKGADGKLYKTPQEAQATYGIPSDRQSQWILIMNGLFEPIHYAFDGTSRPTTQKPSILRRNYEPDTTADPQSR
jgi:hypothetical protein